jgi:hypothetical protein
MKITRSQIRRIIRESQSQPDAYHKATQLLDQMEEGLIDYDEAIEELAIMYPDGQLGNAVLDARLERQFDIEDLARKAAILRRKMDRGRPQSVMENTVRSTHRKILLESMKDLYGELQNEILAIGQEFGGEFVVQDVVDELQNYANDPLGDPKAEYVASLSYEDIVEFMMMMVQDGLLTGGYEDFYEVAPEFMI